MGQCSSTVSSIKYLHSQMGQCSLTVLSNKVATSLDWSIQFSCAVKQGSYIPRLVNPVQLCGQTRYLHGSLRLNCMVNKLPTRYLHFQMGHYSLALRSAKSFVDGPLKLRYMHSKVPSVLDGSMHLGCAVNKAHTFSDASP